MWIVVPAFREAGRLGRTLADLLLHYRDVVVVDDGSDDGTFEAASAYPVWLLRHAVNCGQGAALRTGMDFALERGAELIVSFDADGQHDARDIAALVEPILRDEADVALGSRFLGRAPGIPWTRWIALKVGVIFTRLVSSIKVTDTHNGLRAFSRDAAQRIRITESGMAHASEILDQIPRLGLRHSEVPVTIRYNVDSLQKGQQSWRALGLATRFLLSRLGR